MATPVAPYHTRIALQPRDATPHGTLALPALCAHLQDAAGAHAEQLGVSQQTLLAKKQSWVLTRLHIELDRPPRWDDTLSVETWPSGLTGPFAQRDFVLRVDDAEVGRATSTWVVFDQAQRRMKRPPRALYDLTLPDRPPVLAADIPDVERPDTAGHTRRFRVRFHDLDLNRHVNNARYVAWALETLPIAWLDAHELRALVLHFKHETTSDTPVEARAQITEPGASKAPIRVVHHLRDATASTTLALAETRWAER